MPIEVERTVFKIGEGGFAITLPKAWVKYNRVKSGDKVLVIADTEIIIRVIKPAREEETSEPKDIAR